MTARLYGCHNRAPFKDLVLGGPGEPLVIPFRMARDCPYRLTDLGKAGAGCTGCVWREDPPPTTQEKP